jgi:Concanavalin A-like lectin/glucanases superfamily/Immunoglobulin domain/Bacterial Ig domain/Immunoglobulin I-set domain
VAILNAPGNVIGGMAAGAGNLISGNNRGVFLSGAGARFNRLEGNLVGTDVTGLLDLKNEITCVRLQDAPDNVIGGTVPGARNVISASKGSGIYLSGSGTTNVLIQGNFIGTDAAGGLDLGNSIYGVRIEGGANNLVGGTSAGAGNLIAYNKYSAVLVDGGQCAILGNSIYENDAGISLINGGNSFPIRPVLTAATNSLGATRILGRLNSTPNTTFRVELFASPLSFDDGKSYLDAVSVATDASGLGTFNLLLPTGSIFAQFATATATDPFGNTSEFSSARTIVNSPFSAEMPVASEEFDYSTGTLSGGAGGSGWAGPWVDQAGFSGSGLVLGGSITDPTATLPRSGNHGGLSGALADAAALRNLAAPLGADGTTMWISFLLRPDGSVGSGKYGGLVLGGTVGTGANGLFIGHTSGGYRVERIGTGTGPVVSGIAPAQGVTVFVVARLEFLAGNDRTTVYLNPTPGLTTPDSSYTATYTNLDLGAFTQIKMAGGGSVQQSFDEIRVGASFESVAPWGAPLITEQPQNQSVLVGSTISLSVAAAGTTPLDYQWYFNGAPLTGVVGETLVITNAQFAQSGTYTVSVTNLFGAATSQVAVVSVAAPLPDGLVNWWAGDSNALDYIGTNHGTLLNGATYRTGKVDSAFALDGTNDVVDVGSMPWLGTSTGLTVMAWIHRTNLVNRFGGILGRWQLTGASNSPAATSNTFLLATGEGTVSNRVTLLLQSTNLNSYRVVGATILPTNQWVHVAATWDSEDGAAAVYLNGVRDGMTNLPAGQRLQFLPGYTTKIGSWGNSTNSVNQFRGGIDEVMLLDRAISSNDIQMVYASSAVGLVKAPILTQQPVSQAVVVGSNITLNVAAVGVLPLAYQWNIDGAAIPDATNATLTLNNAQSTNSGNYDVLVSNPAGSTRSQSAEVRVVLDVPVITAQPASATVSEGDTAMFSVTAVGSPPLTYQWAREGSDLIGETNSTLTLTNVAMADAGQFIVLVSNPSGGVLSQDARLTVLPVAPNITTQPMSRTVNDGTNVSFTVVATGTAPLSYRWARNGTFLAGGTNATLNLTNVGVGASGNFTVVVSNIAGSATSQAAVLTVQPVAPMITSQPVSRTVKEGTNISFTVVATGTGPLFYRWARNATFLSGATNATLNLSNVALSASGNYSVVVSNAVGSVISSVAVLTVQPVAPTITSQPVSRTVNEGTNVSFTVAATGTAPRFYQWFYNTTNLAGATNTTLALSNVPLSVAGNYTVIVSNSAGSVTSVVAVLTVLPVAPKITTQPVGRTVLQGTNVSFTVTATGTAPLSYQWARNASALGGATSSTLNLTNVALSAGGNYTVIVSNVAGSVTSIVAVLTVQPVPPTITSQPVSLTVKEGTNVSFTVAATGTATLMYQWAFNSTNVLGATNATLSLSNVALSASGSYVVVVSNSGGSVTSQVAALTVQPLPPAIVTPPTNQTVNEGSNASFTVVAASSVPLTYQWARNAAAISGATNATLSLSNLSLSASGNYTVVVSNSAGFVTSSVAVLTVQPVAPTITSQPVSRTVNEGTNVSFTVAATGTAPRFYQWAWNTTNLAGATNTTLAITNVALSAAGNYTVIVSNSAGSVTSVVAVLTVLPVAPKITTQPVGRTVFEGTNVSFTVTATGTAPLSYQWARNASALGGGTSATLNLTNVALSAGGNYTVIVSNVAGSVTSIVAVLTVQPVPPTITSQPVGRTVNEGTNVSFTVAATGTAPLFYQWSRNASAIPAGTNATLSLTNVPLGASGNYVVIVSNAGGSATSQVAVLTVQAVAPSITTQPVSQTVAVGSNATLSVVATGTAPILYQWQRSGLALPGQTASTLNLNNVQPADAGSYRVLVRNEVGSVLSAEAALTVVLAPLAMTDDFSPVVASSVATGAGYSSNTLATAETGEPLHDGKPGGKSMWFAWRAPAGGVATFATAGSEFDSLLAVYQGSAVNALTRVDSDDDEGGFFNSAVTFNVESNQVYQIAVDGSGGASGRIVLEWLLESTADRRPVITNQPVSQVVVRGTNVTFTVGAVGSGLSYQWYLHGDAIPGATSSALTITNVGLTNAGAYRVHVASGTRVTKSRRAHLQLKLTAAFDQDVGVSDKFRDMVAGGRRLRLDPPPSTRSITRQFAPATASRGYSGTQIFSVTGSLKEPGEPDHCGVVGGASTWLAYEADSDGVLALNTDGSSFDTILAVYTGTGSDFASLIPVECDDNSGTNGLTSSLHFITTSGTTYFIVVDGVNGASGSCVLNYTTLGEQVAPVLAISSAPAANSRLTNGAVTISGTATDGDEITAVEWRLTNNLGATEWTVASGTNTWNFTTTNLEFGPNVIEIRAWDSWANVSEVASRRYILLAPLTVVIDGCGTVSRGYLGTTYREPGTLITLAATPCGNSLNAGWTGDLATNGGTLRFLMPTGLVLQANFATNPFTALRGRYSGLFCDTNALSQASAGFASLRTTTKGTYTGSLRMGAKRHAFSGRLGLDGLGTNIVKRGGTNTPLRLELNLNLGDSVEWMAGRVFETNWTAELAAYRSVFNTRTNPAPYRGRYTLLLPANGAPGTPGGDGYAAVTVGANGLARLSGALGTGTRLSQSATVSREGLWPVYASLHKGKGSVWSWLAFETNSLVVGTNTVQSDLAGDWRWLRPGITNARYYPAGFTNLLLAVGSRYIVPVGSTNGALTFSNGVVALSGGNLTAPVMNDVFRAPNDKVTNEDTNKMSLSIRRSTGLFKGSVVVPETGKTLRFNGAVFQNGDFGSGYFLHTNASGPVWLGPRE